MSYTVQLADDIAFTAIFRQITSADTGITVPDAQLHAMNYWRVVARNSPTTSALSSNYGFFTHPIPVELVSFTASVHDGIVALKWTTASETNNAGFAVERSRDGVDFVQTGFVAGAGTAGLDTEYGFDEPVSDCSYFRLRQIDTDGSFEYSPVLRIALFGSSSPEVMVHPSPISAGTHRAASITYSLQSAEHVTLRVHDISGRIALSLRDAAEEAGTHSALLPASGLPPGTYVVSLLTAKERRVRTFVVLP
ncbi:MAG: T9SS type A sorting domain-containing protein [Ignavibacteria bacterium]|nr:T9SS type A sorting domain-containing protein [Ignavibacteria bacterium]